MSCKIRMSDVLILKTYVLSRDIELATKNSQDEETIKKLKEELTVKQNRLAIEKKYEAREKRNNRAKTLRMNNPHLIY